MESEEDVGFLSFLETQGGTALALVIILSDIAGLHVAIDGLEVNAIVRSKLLLELAGTNELGQFVIRTMAMQETIIRVHRVAAVPQPSIVRGRLRPASIAGVLRRGTQAHLIPIEKPGILL